MVLLLACEQQLTQEQDSLEAKMAPSDHLMLRYAYPDAVPDHSAYLSSMREAKIFNETAKDARSATTAWQSEGPGNSGARINTIAAHPTDADIIIIGYSGGGIFKTTNGGTDWTPVFDDQSVLAISSIVYDESNPNIVYAGTGDLNVSSYPFVGNGIFKSMDGGDSWSYSGLADAGIISRILVDPNNGNIVYAASMGVPFEAGNERGLYKSIDAGASWSKILYLSDITGVIDITMDPFNSSTIYAAGWDRVRNTQESIVVGTGAKIHKSTDGGSTWTQLAGGLPTGNQSRIGLAISQTTPDIIYAVYIGTDFQVEGVYQSFDGGGSWFAASLTGLDGNAMGGFGWYFGQIRTHPNNDQILYMGGVQLWYSVTGGESWSLATLTTPGPSPHVDMHGIQFDANNDILLGTDGGLYRQTTNGGEWFDLENIAATQFYRIAVDPHPPGNYFGGAQDNGTLSGSSAAVNSWSQEFGGDGFSIVFHPTDPSTFYLETQNGVIWKTTNDGNTWAVASNGIDSNDSKPWDMFFSMSPFDPDVLYTGTQSVYESADVLGDTEFTSISGNLTESETAGNAQRYHYVSHVLESEVTQDLLVCGTSDGLVWKRAPGQAWTQITNGLPDRYVTRVVPSDSDDQKMFVTFSGYRDNDNTPHVYFSDDQGSNWSSIAGNMPNLGINDIIALPSTSDSTLFLGTDAGVYFSLDRGAIWEPLGTQMPSVPVYDLAIDEANNRLVAGTFARSIYSFPLDSLPSSASAVSVAGTVVNRFGVAMPNVTITASGQSELTDANGLFGMSLVPELGCGLKAEKTTGDIRNGLTTLDAVLVQRHFIKLDTLTPIQQLAGDVSNSNSISTLDAVLIQRVVILLEDSFARGNWGFLPTSYVIPDSMDVFSEVPPDSISCALGELPPAPDFWAYKVGDVSGNASNTNSPQETPGDEVLLEWQQRNDGLALCLKEDAALYGAQLSLQLETEFNELLSNIDGLLFEYAQGTLSINWANPEQQFFEKGTALFTLAGIELQELLISEEIAALAVCGEKGNIHNSKITITNTTNASQILAKESIRVFPNPSTDYVWVEANQRIESIQLMDITGKLVKAFAASNDKQRLALPNNMNKGMYLLKVQLKDQSTVVNQLVVN